MTTETENAWNERRSELQNLAKGVAELREELAPSNPADRLQALRDWHRAVGESIAASQRALEIPPAALVLEHAELGKALEHLGGLVEASRHSGSISQMSRKEKVELIDKLGVHEFTRRVRAEYGIG
jgi:hypothetical protein